MNQTNESDTVETMPVDPNGNGGEDSLNEVLLFLSGNWFEVAVVALIALGVAAVFLMYRKHKEVDTKDFEETDIKKRVIENLKARGEFIGKKMDQSLYHGEVDRIGGIRWALELTQPADQHLVPDASEQNEKLADATDSEGNVRVFVFLISKGRMTELKEGLEKKLNDLKGEETFNEEICAVPECWLTFRDDKVIIDRDVEFDLNGGIKTARHKAAANVVNEIIISETNDLIRQSLADFTEPVNLLSKDHSQELNKAKALSELSDEPERVEDLFRKS